VRELLEILPQITGSSSTDLIEGTSDAGKAGGLDAKDNDSLRRIRDSSTV